MPDVVTFGEPLILFAPDNPGLLRHVARFTKHVGGTELNTAIGLSRLGVSVGWFGCVGKDEFGSEVVGALAADGVDVSRVKQNDGPTAVMFKEYRGLGDPNVFYYRENSAASRMTWQDIDAEYIQSAKYLHITGITAAISKSSREAVGRAIKIAKEAGVKVSFDPNIRRRLMPLPEIHDLLLPLVDAADILLIGLEEGQLLFQVETPEEIGRIALEKGAQLAAIKMSAEGSFVFSSSQSFQQSIFPVKQVVDTVGAGDGYNAGFLAGLCYGFDTKRAAAMAAVVSACAVTVQGDYEGYPTWDEAERLLAGQSNFSR